MSRYRLRVVETRTNRGYVVAEADNPEEAYDTRTLGESEIEVACHDAAPTEVMGSDWSRGGGDATHYASMIDTTNLGTVKRYFRSPTSEIREVILVGKGVGLAEVAGYLAVEGPGRKIRGLELARCKKIRFAADRTDDVPEPWNSFVVALDELDDSRPCRVIYAPPAYLVELPD